MGGVQRCMNEPKDYLVFEPALLCPPFTEDFLFRAADPRTSHAYSTIHFIPPLNGVFRGWSL